MNRHMFSWLFACLLILTAARAVADTQAFEIVDDPELDRIVTEVREEFLKKRPYDRLDATILIPHEDGTWHRGSYNPEALAYPASCVKLAYLAAAMNWCRMNGHPYEYLDYCVRPMITHSDNVQTGVVVDTITEAPNLSFHTEVDDAFLEWVKKREYTEKYLASRGLLGNQRILHKTYPSNSGESPVGAEKLARDEYNMNRMEPRLSASLLLEIVKGAIEPGSTQYMRSLLRRPRIDDNSALGFGLPPGSIHENKIGVAYDTVEDLMYAVLPNGKEFILTVFTNGRDQNQPTPHDASHLGLFCELMIERTGLEEGLPVSWVIDNTDEAFISGGEWVDGNVDRYTHGDSYRVSRPGKNASVANWNLHVPESGKYEISVWYSQHSQFAPDAPFTVYHDGGPTMIRVNQQSVGGRWVKLGDFQFASGTGRVTLTNQVTDPKRFVAADAVKVSRIPEDPTPMTGTVFAPEASATPEPTPVAAPETIMVRTINLSAVKTIDDKPRGRSSIQVTDNRGYPVAGVEITGIFIGSFDDTVTGFTDQTGLAVLETDEFEKRTAGSIIFTFYIDKITHLTLRYDPQSSLETYKTYPE